ncbi:MAG: DEAD/DEAH box helicase family protein [Candidatus Poribacteria bacterium]|nr:DEAD/DEAH box helicase family protein [Candidatus Poribacteria bacterium]
MKFEFDANQDYQRDAIDAVVQLFEGQIPIRTTLQFGGESNYSTIPNRLDLDSEQIGTRLKEIQEANEIEMDEFSMNGFPNFSVEMETGTGKTYIYLRTVLELFQNYGMRKFIVVVPSVAIREGVLKTLQITESHFKELYDNLPYRYYVYDSEKLSQVRQFALSDSIEIMVITIASFNQPSKNVIYKNNDRLQGEKPIDFIKATRPILILDEPQRMESDLSVEALSNLSPLFALRYSATHKTPYNRLYCLTPYDAYREGLVKRIEVAGLEESANTNRAFVQVKSIQSQKRRGVTAKLVVHKLMKNGTVKQTTLTFKKGDDLKEKTNLPQYQGYRIRGIELEWGEVRFDNNVVLGTGETHGADKKAIFEAQIKYTIEEHFRRLKRLEDANLKVLSLFFIDKVDNYAGKDPIIRKLFDKCFNELKKEDRYSEWREKQPEDVQAAYFAKSKSQTETEEPIYEDTKGEAEKDREVYQLIMKDKERLLSFEEPTCFIFSHSALREGWDSPNVFQICTLNQTVSDMKKRQEIGRGVRLAVNQEGKRVHDEKLNVLTVVANDSYTNYVQQLQTEVKDEFGTSDNMPKPKNARERDTIKLKKAMTLTPEFEALWNRIKHKTRYKVQIDTEKLIEDVVKILDETNIQLPQITISKGRVKVDEENKFDFDHIADSSFEYRLSGSANVLKSIEHRLAHTTPAMKLTRRTLLEILKRTKNQQAALDNPPEFAKVVVEKIRQKIITQLIDGIKYEKIGEVYEMSQFDCELKSWKDCMVPASRSIYDHVIWDSDVEKKFVEGLEKQKGVILYLKLPAFFTVPTPIGNYNPDWAIVKDDLDAHGDPKGKEKLYLVRETKSTTDSEKLRHHEEWKIDCGRRHFCDALNVDYEVVTSAEEV